MISPSFIIVLLLIITSVHVCLLLFVALELYCSLSFASSFCFLSAALAFCYFVEWHCMYASAVTVVGLNVASVTCDASAIGCELYRVWLIMVVMIPVPTIVPWVHGLPSSCWTATADPMGIHGNMAEASLVLICCLSTSLLWCHHHNLWQGVCSLLQAWCHELAY